MADHKLFAKTDIYFGSDRGYAPGSEIAADVVERFNLQDMVETEAEQTKRKAAEAKLEEEHSGKPAKRDTPDAAVNAAAKK